MGLLLDIQSAVLQDKSDIAPILLKLRMLASRLNSQPLADWVRHESEGYPAEIQVPDYRVIGVSYFGSFSGPFGSGINNAPISSFLIEEFAGKGWTQHEMRESIASVDELLAGSKKSGTFDIDASNLILILQGKVYPELTCNVVSGKISRGSIAAIRNAVLNRILELTIEIEKSVPGSAEVSLDVSPMLSGNASGVTTQITNQIIYGNYTSVSAQDGSSISVVVSAGDTQSFARHLTQAGIAEADALKLAEIASSETPDSATEPTGPKVREWLKLNISKAASGAWKMGSAVASEIIKEALLKYYGLK